MRYHKRARTHEVPSVLENSTFWSPSTQRQALDLDYSRGITLRHVTVLGGFDRAKSVGVLTNGESGELVCENVRIEGVDLDIMVPRQGRSSFTGGYLRNRRNIVIQEPAITSRSRSRFRSMIRFGRVREILMTSTWWVPSGPNEGAGIS